VSSRYETASLHSDPRGGVIMKRAVEKYWVSALICVVLLLCFSVACQDKAAMAELEKFKAQAAVEAHNMALVKRLIEEQNKGNAEIVKELYAPDVKSYSPSGSTAPTSQSEDYEIAKTFLSAFPDLNQITEEIFASGDKVTARFIARGTHKGDFQGIPATGNRIEISGILIFHIKDGKIIEVREEADFLGFMTQLGMELKPKEPKK
jgi:steroid delta-isomerase-like uncharacterized protein